MKLLQRGVITEINNSIVYFTATILSDSVWRKDAINKRWMVQTTLTDYSLLCSLSLCKNESSQWNISRYNSTLKHRLNRSLLTSHWKFISPSLIDLLPSWSTPSIKFRHSIRSTQIINIIVITRKIYSQRVDFFYLSQTRGQTINIYTWLLSHQS